MARVDRGYGPQARVAVLEAEELRGGKTECPAYRSEGGRCWLIAGTLCACEISGETALKIESCLKCDVFESAIEGGEALELQELLIILVHNLRQKRRNLE